MAKCSEPGCEQRPEVGSGLCWGHGGERRTLKCPECGVEVCGHGVDAMNGHAAEVERVERNFDALLKAQGELAEMKVAAEAEVERLRSALMARPTVAEFDALKAMLDDVARNATTGAGDIATVRAANSYLRFRLNQACTQRDETVEALRACFVNGDTAEAFDPANPETERIVRAALTKAGA